MDSTIQSGLSQIIMQYSLRNWENLDTINLSSTICVSFVSVCSYLVVVAMMTAWHTTKSYLLTLFNFWNSTVENNESWFSQTPNETPLLASLLLPTQNILLFVQNSAFRGVLLYSVFGFPFLKIRCFSFFFFQTRWWMEVPPHSNIFNIMKTGTSI